MRKKGKKKTRMKEKRKEVVPNIFVVVVVIYS